jgi:hypothetical protein
MSGRNQHFIPQSLLRGFGTKRGNKTYVVAYTFDRGTFAPPTDGIGAQRSFYSELDVEGGSETLDDKITDYEQQIPAVLDRLRQPSLEVDAGLAAELVTHLTVRNDHFRKAASKGSADLFQGMGDALAVEGTAKAMVGVAGEVPSDRFAGQLVKMWEEFKPVAALLGMTQEQFNQFAFQTVKSNFSALHAEIAGPLQDAFGRMVEKIPDVAATAQRRTLSESLSPTKRVERLSEFCWRTIEVAKPLVLPDCVAVGADSANGLLPLMLADLERTETVYMPLSTVQLLIGTLKEPAEQPENLNEVFASSSWDFFVARDRTPELEALRDRLRISSEDFLSGTVEEVLEESLGTGGD